MAILIRLARKLVAKSTNKRYRHVAIVERGGSIVAVGWNHFEIHAEYHALNKLWPSEVRGTKVWSLRFTKTGKLAMAKPCPTCETFLKKWGVKAVWYSTAEGTVKRMKI